MNCHFNIKRLALIWSLIGIFFLSGGIALALDSPNGPNYLQNALINGHIVQRWNNDTKVINISIESGSGVADWRPEDVSILKSAFTEWQNALGQKIKFAYTHDSNKTDILVTWENRSEGLEVGHQDITWNNNTLTNADIVITLSNPQGRVFTNGELRHIALHEIGHALGIRGHSGNPNDIMYPSLQANITHLSARDIATIRDLYQMKADIANPQNIHLLQFREYNYYVRMACDANAQKDFQSAYAYFLKAQQYYPSAPHIYYYIGISAYNLHLYNIAIQNLEKAVMVQNTDQSASQYFLASSLMLEGAQEIESGNKTSGLQKLNAAKQQYRSIIYNPKMPSQFRQKASHSLNILSNVSISQR